MKPKSTTREHLRQKRRDKKRQKFLLILLITLAVNIIFGLAVIIPKILLRTPKSKQSQGFTIGNPDAPVKVIQFSSYYCSFCKNFSENVESRFIRDYVEPGLVYYRYVNLPGDGEASQQAAVASYCAADQNRFFDYKDLLYTYSAAEDGFSANNLNKYANLIGLDKNDFESCLYDTQYKDAYEQDLLLAEEAGVTGTPSFLVNDQLVYSNDLFATIDSLINN